MQPRLIITRANGKCVIDTSVEEDKAIMITVVPAMPHTAFVTVGALNAALQQYMKDGCKGPAAPKEEGAPTGTGGYLDKAAVLKAISKGTWAFPPYTLANFFEQLQHGEFDVKVIPQKTDPWVMAYEKEIARLKYQITGYHEAIEVLRESKDKEITHLKDEIEKRNVIIRDHCAEISKLKKSYEDGYKEYEKVERENTELRKEKYETWSRVIQQDQELKDLGKALEEKKTSVGLSDFFKGMKILEASSTQESEYLPDPQNINENIRVGTGIWNIHIRARCVKKEPPKDEPELRICPGKCDGCSHGKPHEYNEDCNNVCGPSRCIPVKKEQTAPQAQSESGSDFENSSLPQMTKDIGDLTLRMDKLESRFDEVTNNLINGMDEGFGLRDGDIRKLKDALKSLKEEVAAIPRPPKDRENYYEIDLGPGFQKIYISKNSVYPVPDQDAGRKKE